MPQKYPNDIMASVLAGSCFSAASKCPIAEIDTIVISSPNRVSFAPMPLRLLLLPLLTSKLTANDDCPQHLANWCLNEAPQAGKGNGVMNRAMDTNPPLNLACIYSAEYSICELKKVHMTKRAAMYVRMSTEHQQYSIVNQEDAIERYAAEHKLTIVKKFRDPGKSGLTLAGRPALRQLLLEVLSGDVQFEHVLVYDVSRWGRFQDADESAYYEYTCKKANIRLHYCGEQFTNDGSPYSALLKALKRTMAGEYSRELSVKVHTAQRRFAGMGFHQGGSAGYGLRRLLVDASGSAKRLLDLGQRKDLPTDRVILVPGPAEEIAVVQKIFKWFTTERHSEGKIATMLNERKIKAERCKRSPNEPKWTPQRVHRILTSARYIGTTVYNRTSNKLSEGTIFNPSDQWVCREGTLKPLVERQVFLKAQNIVQRRSFRPDNYQILDQLSALLKRTGKISERIISKEKDLPCVAVIIRHFKSLLVVYELIGYKPVRDYDGIASRRQDRISKHGVKSMGEGIRVAVASGQLPETFTLSELKAVFPGWSTPSYASFSAHCVGRNEGDPLKLKRVGRGKYQVVNAASPSRRTAENSTPS